MSKQSTDHIDDQIRWLETNLTSVINRTRVSPDGNVYEIRYLVDVVSNLRIIIHPNEHPPPHFHVKADQFEATFDVRTCELLEGKIKPGDVKKIKHWHKEKKNQVIEAWNKLRPDDCPVGRIE